MLYFHILTRGKYCNRETLNPPILPARHFRCGFKWGVIRIREFTLLYTGAHLGAYYCMDIKLGYSGVYHMEQRDHAIIF